MANTLYICYFGVRQPLVQTQVIPYLVEIAKDGWGVTLLTFEPEKWEPAEIVKAKADLAIQGIDWQHLAYHKTPSAIATAWDILAGAFWIRRAIKGRKLDVLHGRAHVATLMGAVARKLSAKKPKLLFDIRGFMPEEYTDAGVWPEGGSIYRVAKRAERWLLRVSDGFVVLTEKARDILFASETKPVEVIPCCVDFGKRFTEDNETLRVRMRENLGLNDRRVLIHVGALGGLYLTQELAEFIKVARDREASTYAIFLTQTDSSEINAALLDRGFTDKDFFIGRVAPDEIPAYLAASDAGLSFVKATYSTQSRSPTKIPEYLAAGLPVIANAGVGDVDALINEDGVGVLVDRFDETAYSDAVSALAELGDINEECQAAARSRFDLETVGGPRYRRLYKNLLQR